MKETKVLFRLGFVASVGCLLIMFSGCATDNQARNQRIINSLVAGGMSYDEARKRVEGSGASNARETASPTTASTYFDRGLAYFNKGDYDRAIADYTQAIRLDPNYVDAYNNRGTAYGMKDDHAHAIADFNQAILLNPNYADAYNNRGTAYASKKDYDEAIADYSQAILLDPNDADTCYFRGNAYFMKADYQQAIADYTQALKLNPNHPGAKRWLEEARKRVQ